jgi:hypothetical protein
MTHRDGIAVSAPKRVPIARIVAVGDLQGYLNLKG